MGERRSDVPADIILDIALKQSCMGEVIPKSYLTLEARVRLVYPQTTQTILSLIGDLFFFFRSWMPIPTLAGSHGGEGVRAADDALGGIPADGERVRPRRPQHRRRTVSVLFTYIIFVCVCFFAPKKDMSARRNIFASRIAQCSIPYYVHHYLVVSPSFFFSSPLPVQHLLE
jgi:hypothetical protein